MSLVHATITCTPFATRVRSLPPAFSKCHMLSAIKLPPCCPLNRNFPCCLAARRVIGGDSFDNHDPSDRMNMKEMAAMGQYHLSVSVHKICNFQSHFSSHLPDGL
ncbi:hypothetical protein E2C01_048369 [Portunus trituberculatus]|uniref:Uncharacterized protein n=1 Tax=Portunus trituberculatus TaxID=210409 RepID=A0A5B7GAY9_PORTR|nr:hypothetical protein [Portunus trituberculatus]